MNRVYPNRIDWENEPSTNTPINETNLNKIDYAVYEIDGRVVTFDTTKANQTDLLQTIKTLTYNTQTGVFVFTFWNGSTYTVDLNIEKIPVDFSMDENGVITMTTADGTTYTCDISTLIKLYTFVDSSEIDFTTTTDASGNKNITASIKSGSITGDKLQPNFLADCQAAKAEAELAASSADADALVSEGFAVGEQNGVPVPSTSPYYHNNAKWYSEQANPTTLANLTDTDIDNPQANQPLSYDGEKWINNSGLMLVSSGEKTLWNDVGNLYKYTLLDQVAQINSNVSGSVPPIAVKDYSKGELFIQQKKLLKAITNISLGDDLIKNTNYIEVNVGDELGLKTDISAIGTDESGRTTASRAYAYGERFYKDGKFCRTKGAVAQGATWVLNSNYEEGTIADWLKYSAFQVEPETGVTFITNQGGIFGKTVDVYIKMTTFADSDVQSHRIGTSALRPCTDYAFLNIMRDYDPYEVIGQVFITGSDGRVGMPRGLPTNTNVFIQGQFVTKD